MRDFILDNWDNWRGVEKFLRASFAVIKAGEEKISSNRKIFITSVIEDYVTRKCGAEFIGVIKAPFFRK